MPREKCNRVNKNKILLMKNIKSRLIKISIKVENYIYKQKMISSIQAKSFLDEISSYEPLCEGDAQYLQVIEKLTKYLNIVISHEDSTIDNSIDKVNNTRESETYEIPNINSPMSEVVDKNIIGSEYLIHDYNKQCNLPNLNKEHTDDCTSSNKSENNKQVEDKTRTELTKNNVNNDFELSTRNIEMNTDRMSEMDSITPLDLRKPVKKYSIVYSNWTNSLNKSIDNNTPKVSGKVEKLETATITEVSNKLTVLKLNKEVNCQDKPKNKFKTDNKCMKNENINDSKSNILITQEQPLKNIQGCTNTQFIQTSSFKIVFNPQNKAVRTSDNDVANIAEKKLKEILHKNKTKPNISIQNEITKKNIINEDKVKNNLNEKPKNKRKPKKELNVKEKRVKKEKDNNVKKGVNKTKYSETMNAKKSQTKQNLNKYDMKLDLSWFDDIKFIRQVDEQEYFKITNSDERFQKK